MLNTYKYGEIFKYSLTAHINADTRREHLTWNETSHVKKDYLLSYHCLAWQV